MPASWSTKNIRDSNIQSWTSVVPLHRVARVITGEIMPNLLSVVMVEVGLRFTFAILLIASLSFLSFGIQPPAADWGLMINENRIGLTVNPWGVLVPVILIAVLTVGLNTFTDSIARISLGLDRPTEQMDLVATGIASETAL